ncbi:MAG: 3-phosphoshikimate 1-carboxyvinyltransferase [Candidatus Margulisbacteria bacterium]|nr:3-phosphoshikimate 1-carboxyvinyltransferase [Candidatus Margulisiibacteriota bacterium]
MHSLEVKGQSLPINTTISVPADKSISHRAIIFSALAQGTTIINNFLTAEDTLNTLKIFRQLGVPISRKSSTVIVTGVGLYGLKKTDVVLNSGNSGTGIRLILGVLAGQNFSSVITGDESIRTRPMKRVVLPLTQMGAVFYSQDKNKQWVSALNQEKITAPLKVVPGKGLSAIKYEMPVSSAQVKSAVLLAGLYAKGVTEVIDPGFSRDHTERTLAHFGVNIVRAGRSVLLHPARVLVSPGSIQVPADISSAAFWMVLGLIAKNARIILPNVGLNPTRTGILSVLKQMGADLIISNESQKEGEPIGDIEVKSSKLQAIKIEGDIVPTLIDEIPIIAVAAAFAQGKTVIRNAAELRVKESDRIKTTIEFLRNFGVEVEELEDGLIITGQCKLKPATCDSHKDHRIAMSCAIMSSVLTGTSSIIDVDCISTSYPGFIENLRTINREARLH